MQAFEESILFFADAYAKHGPGEGAVLPLSSGEVTPSSVRCSRSSSADLQLSMAAESGDGIMLSLFARRSSRRQTSRSQKQSAWINPMKMKAELELEKRGVRHTEAAVSTARWHPARGEAAHGLNL